MWGRLQPARGYSPLASVSPALALLLAFPAIAADGDSVTHHQVTIASKPLTYTARAGLIPIRDNNTGDPHANMFFVSYTLDRAPGTPPRPLTFFWNGGPGSNAGLVHLLGFGPKRVTAAGTGTTLIDNQDTWLAFTDLVFVDPIGTGYSRPTKPEYAGEFYQGRGDAESVAEFIRVYRLRPHSNNVDAYDAPLYILGESYGVTRCALVAEALEKRHTNLAGVILLSGGFPLADLGPGQRSNLNLPTLTAAAWYNKKLPPDLQSQTLPAVLRAAENYASTFPKIDSLTPEQRNAVAAQLARFTGLPISKIDRAKLTVPMEQFAVDLLADKNQFVGHYDSRLIGPRDPAPQYDPTTDPSLKDILDNVSVLRYLRKELNYQNDLNYQGPFGGAYPPPTTFRGDWMSTRWNRTGPQPSPGDGLRSAMKTNPALRLLVVSGYYDLVSSYYAIEQAATQLPADLKPRVTVRTYAGGHAIYTDDAVRHQLRLEATQFFAAGGPK